MKKKNYFVGLNYTYCITTVFCLCAQEICKNARDVDARSNPDPAHIVSIRQKRFMQVQQKQINIAHPVHQILH